MKNVSVVSRRSRRERKQRAHLKKKKSAAAGGTQNSFEGENLTLNLSMGDVMPIPGNTSMDVPTHEIPLYFLV